MTTPRDLKQAAHPIQLAARRTELSTYVLRAWEQRYGVVTPQRSTSGRRLYSAADIERLQLLQFATRTGRRIGDIANLTHKDLVALCAADSCANAISARNSTLGDSRWQIREHYRACMHAIHQLDPPSLESTLYNAALVVSLPVLLEELLTSLLHDIGAQCRKGAIRIGEEHMATAVIRSFLGTLTLNRNVQPSDPRMAVATPTGQRHELGALMAAVTEASEGWNAIYLGADIPADEIAAAAMQTQARAVAISIIYPTDDGNLFYELQRLHRQLSSDVLLWTGGAGALRCRTLLKEVHAVH